MASMTDIVFLLLLFFVIASTMSSPNSIKINLPQSSAQTTTPVVARVTIDEFGRYFVAHHNARPIEIQPEELEGHIMSIVADDAETFIALDADLNTVYEKVVRVLDIANQHNLRLVISTRAMRR
jgi:biopolymer transport protein ExbD